MPKRPYLCTVEKTKTQLKVFRITGHEREPNVEFKKKGKKMKKMILMVVALLSMTATFAEDTKVNNANAFDMSVNYNKLGEALNLNSDQLESLQDVHKAFCAEMLNAANAEKDEQKVMMDKAIKKDLKFMRYILSNKQYRKYLMLLNVTLNNRGLNK